MPTTKHGIPLVDDSDQILTGPDAINDALEGFDAIIARADQGIASSRPTSTPGTPGKTGRFYWATDTKVLSYDYGTGWVAVYDNEPWRLVGAVGQPAFENGWHAYTDALTYPPAFYKHLGIVYLGGAVANPASSGASTAFTLPVGYRPAPLPGAVAGRRFPINHPSFSGGGCEVTQDGSVVLGVTANSPIWLDSISFRAEQ